jgi:hypothetical protein
MLPLSENFEAKETHKGSEEVKYKLELNFGIQQP